MDSSIEPRDEGDDLARQRRKRDARLLEQPVIGFPALTLADVVADVLAVSDTSRGMLDVPSYLAIEGHDWRTIETVVGYLGRHDASAGRQPSQLPLR